MNRGIDVSHHNGEIDWYKTPYDPRLCEPKF